MKLENYINKIKTTAKNNKNGENSSIMPRFLHRKNHERGNSVNSFFSIKSSNFINRHKNFLSDHFRDSKSDNNLNLCSPDHDNINNMKHNSYNTNEIKSDKKNTHSPSIKSYFTGSSLKNEKPKCNKHIPEQLSKFTSHLKSNINYNNYHSNSLCLQDERNNGLLNSESFMISTPKSLPVIVNSNPSNKIDFQVVNKSKTPILKEGDYICNVSNDSFSSPSPSLNYQTEIKSPLNKNSNSSESLPISKEEKSCKPGTSHKSSLSSLKEQKFNSNTPSQGLIIKSEMELKNNFEKKNNIFNNNNYSSIVLDKSEPISYSTQVLNNYTSSKDQNQDLVKTSLTTLDSKRDNLINKNKEIKNMGQIDTLSTTCTNSNCTTICDNISYDKYSELKEISSSLSQDNEIIEDNSTATINRDDTTYSLFMPKTLIGNGGLQNSMQREFNGIIERFDQDTLNEWSSIDPYKEDIPTIGNKVLLNYLNNDLIKGNDNKNRKMSFSEISNDENQSQTAYQENSIIELDNSSLEEQKNLYI